MLFTAPLEPPLRFNSLIAAVGAGWFSPLRLPGSGWGGGGFALLCFALLSREPSVWSSDGPGPQWPLQEPTVVSLTAVCRLTQTSARSAGAIVFTSGPVKNKTLINYWFVFFFCKHRQLSEGFHGSAVKHDDSKWIALPVKAQLDSFWKLWTKNWNNNTDKWSNWRL